MLVKLKNLHKALDYNTSVVLCICPYKHCTNILIDGSDTLREELILFPIETLGIQSVFATLFPYSHNGGSWFITCILICYFFYPLLQILTKGLSDNYRVWIILILGFILLWSPFVQYYFHLQTIYSNPFF